MNGERRSHSNEAYHCHSLKSLLQIGQYPKQPIPLFFLSLFGQFLALVLHLENSAHHHHYHCH